MISRSLVQFPAGALWSVLGQDSLFHIASVHPAEKRVPSIDKSLCAICCELLWNISRGIEMVSVCTVPVREGRLCEHFGGYKTINRTPSPLHVFSYFMVYPHCNRNAITEPYLDVFAPILCLFYELACISMLRYCASLGKGQVPHRAGANATLFK